MSTYYITTAIDYPNGNPHLGHAYEKVITDFYARYHKSFNGDSYFLTGTDENGQKLIKSADAVGKKTGEFVDENVEVFRKLCSSLNISNGDFIRTTEQRHKDFVQNSWKNLASKELIYQGTYSGHYCYDCENFYNKSQAKDLICPEHGKPLVEVEEKGYFFKLSAFHDQILNHIKTNSDFIKPESARKHILSRIESEPLKDIAISRPNEGWGIEVPGDDKFVVYTWFDALMNYVSGLDQEQFKKYWPANTHVIGKDITWFHTIIWPAILMGLEIDLPHQVYVHGMVLDENGRKMSKSLNNGVDPMEMINKYPIDTFRFYLLYAIPAQADGSFSEAELINTHNTILANDYGNLLSRIVKLAVKKLKGEKLVSNNYKQDQNFTQTSEQFHSFVKGFEHNRAIMCVRDFVQQVNQYVNDSAPWQYKEEADLDKFKSIAYNCVYAIHCAAFYYNSAMPGVYETIMSVLKPSITDKDPTSLFGEIEYDLVSPDILFTKIDQA